MTGRMLWARCRIFGAMGLLIAGVATAAAMDSPSSDPTQQWQLDFESGILWHFTGSASPLDYVFLPQVLSLVAPADFERRVLGGELVLRSRCSLLLEPILQSPEHHYYGASAAGLLEWWDDRRTRCLFFTGGGGFGWLDAKGYEVPGGQGQEFNFNWLIYTGGRIRVSERCNASAGIYYQHVSNGHLDKLDPGVNAIGPMLNIRWRF
jgi:lipid A 3-O-deacylase